MQLHNILHIFKTLVLVFKAPTYCQFPPPDVYEGDGDHGDEEVEGGGGQHEVHAADPLLVEGDTAPGGLGELPALVHQVVHLEESV